MRKKAKNISFWKSLKQNQKIRFIAKLFLSLFVLYHLFMIFISPHIRSLAHKKFMPFFAPYANTFSLNTSWNFYTPNPNYYYYFSYDVMDLKSKAGSFRWPPKRKESKRIYLNHNRLIHHARFFITAGPRNIRRYFIPYLCHLHPSARKISLKVKLKHRRLRFKKKSAFFSAKNQESMEEWPDIILKCPRKKKQRQIDSHEPNEYNINQTGFEKGAADEVISTSRVDMKKENSNQTSIETTEKNKNEGV